MKDIPYDIYINNFSHQMIIPIIFISPVWIFRQNRRMIFIMKRKYYRLQSLPTIGNFYKLKLNCKIKNYDLVLLIDGLQIFLQWFSRTRKPEISGFYELGKPPYSLSLNTRQNLIPITFELHLVCSILYQDCSRWLEHLAWSL